MFGAWNASAKLSQEHELYGGWLEIFDEDAHDASRMRWKHYSPDGHVELTTVSMGVRETCIGTYTVVNDIVTETYPYWHEPWAKRWSINGDRLYQEDPENSDIQTTYKRAYSPPDAITRFPEQPQTLEEAFVVLEQIFAKEELQRFRESSEEELSLYHFTWGMLMRSTFGLWRGSALSHYFNELGIRHADHMSGIIVATFWRHLHGEPLRFDEVLQPLRDYENYTYPPKQFISPIDGAAIDMLTVWSCDRAPLPTRERFIQWVQHYILRKPIQEIPDYCQMYIGVSTSDVSIWAYQYHRGIFQLDNSNTEKILNLLIERYNTGYYTPPLMLEPKIQSLISEREAKYAKH